jgi:SGNH domain (fused to AT3 domains)
MTGMQSSRRPAWLTRLTLAVSLLVIAPGTVVAVAPPPSPPMILLRPVHVTDSAGMSLVEPRTGQAATRSLPTDLVPSLRNAHTKPRSYYDGCHARSGESTARACVYGVRTSHKTVLLYGDSHAAQWLPALEDIAAREGWKLYYLTKSACAVANVPKAASRSDCYQWRHNAMAVIADIHPDLVIAASSDRIDSMPRSTASARRAMWRDAWASSLRSLRTRARKVILLGDTPRWAREAVPCLTQYPHDIGRCDTSRSRAISASATATDRGAAEDAGVPYVSTATLVCRGDPCHAVWGRHLVLYDDQHMTVKWAHYIDPDLFARLPSSVLPKG